MMRKNLYFEDGYAAAGWIIAALAMLRPPENLRVSQWAEKYRVLDARSSAMPGRWRNAVAPYLVGFMDLLNDPAYVEIVFVKPAQVGGTEALYNMLGYIIMQDPAPTILVYPTDELAEFSGENRIVPMIRACPELRRLWDERRSLKSELQFAGMQISILGSNSPSKASSRPARFLIIDEADKHPGAGRREAGSISLYRERTKSFHNRKIILISTPTVRTGAVWQAKEAADLELHYFVPCVHCGAKIEFLFGKDRLIFPDEDLPLTQRAERAFYVCPDCGAVIHDRDKPGMLERGGWEPVRGDAASARSVALWFNTLYSPFVRFSDVAREFLLSKDDPEKLQNFINSWLAEPWEEVAATTSVGELDGCVVGDVAGVVPDWAKILTAGVDVQKDRLYWVVRAWGDHMKSQLVLNGICADFGRLAEVLRGTFTQAGGAQMRISLAAVDSGDRTDEVYGFYLQNLDFCVACKGVHSDAPYAFKLSVIDKVGSSAAGLPLLTVNGSKYKDMIFGRVRGGTDATAWLIHADASEDYRAQITNEKRVVVRKNGVVKELWQPKFSHAPNHYLDCEVYAFAAADKMGARYFHLAEGADAAETDAAPDEENPRGWIDANAAGRIGF
jgi:phage terminase large subunit GpA-like protein